MQHHLLHLDERQYVTVSLKGLKIITNNQYEPACEILALLDIFKGVLAVFLKFSVDVLEESTLLN